MSARAAQRILNGRMSVTAVIVRTGAGSRNEYGEWIEGAETREDVRLATAPLTAAERRDVLPEGLRPKSTRRFWLLASVSPLTVGQDAATPDAIEYEGEVYSLLSVDPWGGFFEAVGVVEEA